MNNLLFMGSPRKNGNTVQAANAFQDELFLSGEDCVRIDLYDKKIQPCIDCRRCQADHSIFGCPIQDDLQEIFDLILASDRIILATPIYSWFCTPPMKCMIDRLVRGMNKYYGAVRGPALWQDKELALLITCGYPPEKGADLFVEGMRRYAKHSKLRFSGSLALHDPAKNGVFWTPENDAVVRSFARELLAANAQTAS